METQETFETGVIAQRSTNDEIADTVTTISSRICRTIPREEQWPFDAQERSMMRQAGYIFE